MRSVSWLIAALVMSGGSLPGEYMDVPGARLFYSDTGGQGIAVVLLHAASGSVRNWEFQQQAFAAAGYRVIAYDRRGWGRTEVDAGAKSVPAAEDLLALADGLGLQRFHLLGTAAGGIVAIDFALSYPERLRSLVIANSIGGMQDAGFAALGRRLRPSPQFEALPPEFREVGPEYRAENQDGTRRWMELEKASRIARGAPQPLRNRLTLAAVEKLKLPVLILSGGADLYAPPALMRMFSDRIPGAAFVNLPDAGHSAYWEQPETFDRAVLDFMRRH